MGTFLDKTLKLDAGSPDIDIIKNGIKAMQNIKTEGEQKKWEPAYIKELITAKKNETMNAYNERMKHRQEILEGDIKNYQKTWDDKIENHPQRGMERVRTQDYFESLTNEELQTERDYYILGESKRFDPLELEIMAREVRTRLGNNAVKPLKEKMTERNYAEPWRKMMPEPDRNLLDALKARPSMNMVVLSLKEEGDAAPSLTPYSFDNIMADEGLSIAGL